MGKQPGCDRKGMEQMGRMLVGIAIGMLIVLVAFFAWALCRVAGDADEQAEQSRRYDGEKLKWPEHDLRADG